MTRALAAGLLLLGSAALAAPIDDLLTAHAACDGSEFAVLARNADALGDKLPLVVKKGAVATIPVPDRREKGKRTVRFREPLPALGITLVGYSDEIDAYGPELQFLFWGFLVREDVAAVARALMPHVPESDRMKRDPEGNHLRLEVFDGHKWREVSNPLTYAGVPGQFVERAYIIERSDEAAFPGTRVSCSLQGPVGKHIDLLSAARPDLR